MSCQTGQGYQVKYKSDQKYSSERAELEEQRRHLIAELMTCRTSLGHVEKDLDRLRLDIINSGTGFATRYIMSSSKLTALLFSAAVWNSKSRIHYMSCHFTEQGYREKLGAIQDTRKRTRLLVAHSQHVSEELEKYDEYKNRIVHRTENLQYVFPFYCNMEKKNMCEDYSMNALESI